MDLKLILH